MHSNTISKNNIVTITYPEALSQAKVEYDGLGIDTIPIKLGEKAPPLVKGWQCLNTADLWLDVSVPVNIAIRCGGAQNLAVIDCDEAKTPGLFDQIMDYLYLQGLNPDILPIVQTASGIGRHIYLRTNVPTNGNYILLNPKFGAGEFRYGSGAYVLAPPSVVNRSKYELISGDFSNIPTCEFASLELILQLSTQKSQSFSPPAISPKKKSQKAWKLLNGDKRIIQTYPSRSEADSGLMLSLINSGYSKAEIFDLFNRYPCTGKYADKLKNNKRAAQQYFDITYDSALKKSANVSEGMQIALNAKKWALDRPWPGRSGVYDRAVFLAHTDLAYRCAKVEYGASGRELATLVPTITDTTADRATNRLIKQGFLVRTRDHTAIHSPIFRFDKTNALPQNIVDEECITFQNHEVFTYRALGLSSKQILDSLIFKPKTIDELINDTGRNIETIKKWLYRMARIVNLHTGEIHALVICQDGRWSINDQCDLDEIAVILGVSGKMAKRSREFQEQRREYTRFLNFGNKRVRRLK